MMKEKLKKLFRPTLFKKTFLIIFGGFIIVESMHIKLDYRDALYSQAYNFYNETAVNKMYHLQEKFNIQNDNEFQKSVIKEFENSAYHYVAYTDTTGKIVVGEYLGKYKPLMTMVLQNKDDDIGIRINLKGLKENQIEELENYLYQEYLSPTNQNHKIYVSGKKEKKSEYVSDDYTAHYIEIKPSYLKIDNTMIINGKKDNEESYFLSSYNGKKLKYDKFYDETRIIYYPDRIKRLQTAVTNNEIVEAGTYGHMNNAFVVSGDDLIIIQYYYLEKESLLEQPSSEIPRISVAFYQQYGAKEILNNVIDNKKNIYYGAFALSIVMAMIISYLLTKRIKKIDAITKKISENNFDEKLNEKSQDELGTLSHHINTMSVQLKHTIEQLNNEIQRVKQLEGLRKEFIANFTHEMKTPLGIINGYIELIEESQDENKIKQYLSAIDQETKRVNHLVIGMLNLSRLECGKVELKKEIVDMNDLLASVIDQYSLLLEKKKIKIHVQGGDFMLNCDKKQMEIVLHNFMSNAIKHTPESMDIYITSQEDAMMIENEGSHIKEEQMGTIWETYVSSERDGTGLGLAICKTILELHNLKYGVYNTKRGVCFYFGNVNQ